MRRGSMFTDAAFVSVSVIGPDGAIRSSFVSARWLGQDGMLALVGPDAGLRVEQDSNGVLPYGAAASLMPAHTGRWLVARGVRLIQSADGFGDGRPRVLGWRRSSAYPLVGLSQHAVLAGADAYWGDSRNRALLTNGILALLAAASMLSLRAAVRARERHAVQRAYRAATESGNSGFYTVAPVRDRKGGLRDFRVVDCNERNAYFYGLACAGLIGMLVSRLDRGIEGAELTAGYREAMRTGFHEEDRRLLDAPPPDHPLGPKPNGAHRRWPCGDAARRPCCISQRSS